MKRIRICWKCLIGALKRIPLVDRCLMAFMLVLLLQSAYSVLSPWAAGSGAGDIDIVVRTSSAAIFGYFLSANFIRRTAPAAGDTAAAGTAGTLTGSVQTEEPQSRIGFSVPGEEPELGGATPAPARSPAPEEETTCRLQILVATAIGLFCLVTLLLLRDVVRWQDEPANAATVAATAAQFRDFVSGCVGFLIGCPTHSPGKGGETSV